MSSVNQSDYKEIAELFRSTEYEVSEGIRIA